MSSPAPTFHPYAPHRTITIENGDVVKDDKVVYVTPGAIVKFSNFDPCSYTITFLVNGEDRNNPFAVHPDVDLFLPAFGTATTLADPYVLTGQCDYELEETDPGSVGRGFTKERIEKLRALVSEARALAENSADADVDSANESSIPLKLSIRMAGRAGGGGGGTIHIGG
jgi:hypothetical protein